MFKTISQNDFNRFSKDLKQLEIVFTVDSGILFHIPPIFNANLNSSEILSWVAMDSPYDWKFVGSQTLFTG